MCTIVTGGGGGRLAFWKKGLLETQHRTRPKSTYAYLRAHTAAAVCWCEAPPLLPSSPRRLGRSPARTGTPLRAADAVQSHDTLLPPPMMTPSPAAAPPALRSVVGAVLAAGALKRAVPSKSSVDLRELGTLAPSPQDVMLRLAAEHVAIGRRLISGAQTEPEVQEALAFFVSAQRLDPSNAEARAAFEEVKRLHMCQLGTVKLG